MRVPDSPDGSRSVNCLRTKQHDLLQIRVPRLELGTYAGVIRLMPQRTYRSGIPVNLNDVPNVSVGIFHHACWHGFLLAECSRVRYQDIRWYL